LDAHGISDVRQTEMHTPEPSVPKPSSSEVEIDTKKLKRYKSARIVHILAELIQTGSNYIKTQDPKNLLILFGVKKSCHSSGRNVSL
jgi:hypothetical protein